MQYSLPVPAELTGSHLQDAKLYATRWDLMVALANRPYERIAEVGVGYGDFSIHMMAALHPQEFHAYDLFDLHEHPFVLGIPSVTRFQERTHSEYYTQRFPDAKIYVGDSSANMNKQPDKYYDLIYIDGAHDYDGVKRDTESCLRTIKDDGILVYNDYTPFDPIAGLPYGVMQAVNDLCVNHGWRMTALALQPLMFCDVALTRG